MVFIVSPGGMAAFERRFQLDMARQQARNTTQLAWITECIILQIVPVHGGPDELHIVQIPTL